jgi:hypothetical protein
VCNIGPLNRSLIPNLYFLGPVAFLTNSPPWQAPSSLTVGDYILYTCITTDNSMCYKDWSTENCTQFENIVFNTSEDIKHKRLLTNLADIALCPSKHMPHCSWWCFDSRLLTFSPWCCRYNIFSLHVHVYFFQKTTRQLGDTRYGDLDNCNCFKIILSL